MMRTPPGRRGLAATRSASSDPNRPRAGRSSISRVEALEARDLLAAAGQVLPLLPEIPDPSAEVLARGSATQSDAPRVAFVQFQPLTGRVQVTYTGNLAGYSTATLTNPANYRFQVVKAEGKLPTTKQSRPEAGVVLAPAFRVTGVALPTPVAPGMPQTVVVSINNNQPIRNGVYRFTIHSPGITDLAGRPLEGQYAGTFPTGGSGTGGDFAANLVQTRSTILPAQPVGTPAGPSDPHGVAPGYVFVPSVTAVRVRYAAAKPGKFVLAGGNNITLIPLANQDFPGTFRPSKPKAR